MADEAKTATEQPTNDAPQAGAQQTPAPEAGQQEQPRMFPESYVKELRDEAAGYRVELRETKKGLEELTNLFKQHLGVDKPEDTQAVSKALEQVSGLAKQVESLNSKLVDTEVKSAVIAAAARVGMADPEDAYRMIDRETLKLKEDGSIDGVDEAVKALADAKPYLLGKTTAPKLPPSNPAGDSTPVNPILQKVKGEYFGGVGPSPFGSGEIVLPPDNQ